MDKNKVATLKDKDVILYDIIFNDLIKGKGINIGEGEYIVHLSLNDRRQVSNVYYVSETGELQSLAFTQKENEVIFKTTHFSLYAVEFKKVESNQNSTVKPQENEKPNINTKKRYRYIRFNESRICCCDGINKYTWFSIFIKKKNKII